MDAPSETTAAATRRQTIKNTSTAGLGSSVVPIQPFAHFLARLEKRDALLINRHMRAGSRIASGAGWTVLDRECPEPAQLDPVAPGQGRDDLIEDRVYNVLDIPLIEMR